MIEPSVLKRWLADRVCHKYYAQVIRLCMNTIMARVSDGISERVEEYSSKRSRMNELYQN